jgi:hypothetical protein
MHGEERALDVKLRALYTEQALYLLAQWPDEALAGERTASDVASADPQNVTSNVFTVHWRLPDSSAQQLDCTVACHTVFADGTGRLAYANAETIPQGGSGALEAAGGRQGGTWTIEWSRPLVNGNPYDLQFGDLELEYFFLVKVFRRSEDRPDPISERHQLVFHP